MNLFPDLYDDGITVIPNIFDSYDLQFLARLSRSESDTRDFFSTLPDELKFKITTAVVSLLERTYGSYGWSYSGESNIVYTKETQIVNISNNALKLHRDIRGVGTLLPLTSKVDSLVRVGIYLQDTYHSSYGTKFILGSHSSPVFFRDWLFNFKHFLKGQISLRYLFFDLGLSRIFSARNIPTMHGDMIIWTSRTLHSACYKRLRFISSLVLPPALERLLPESFFLPLKTPRNVLFFGFCLKTSSIAQDYILQRKAIGAIK